MDPLLAYYTLIAGIGLAICHFGTVRCKFCTKMRLDGHKKDCPRYKAPKERWY